MDTKIPLGNVVVTPRVQEIVAPEDIMHAIERHAAGDWGAVSSTDRTANNRAIEDRTRVLSVYVTAQGVQFWVITESDRSVTTVLLPEDY